MVYMSNCPHMAYTFFALANTKNIAVFVDPNSPEIRIADKIKRIRNPSHYCQRRLCHPRERASARTTALPYPSSSVNHEGGESTTPPTAFL